MANSSAESRYLHYWGKASPPEDSAHSFHLLPFHSLDVAAVGASLLQHHRPIADHLAALLGMSDAEFPRWAVLFLALHDLGKFAITFQRLRSDLLLTMQGRETDKQSRHRHDTLGYLLWKKSIRQAWQENGLLPKPRPRTRVTPDAIESADIWMAAMTGHHGTPPKPVDMVITDAFEPVDQQAANIFVGEIIELLLPDRTRFPEIDVVKLKQASWWLAGFAVLCDWIGSNSDFFPYRTTAVPLSSYWEIARAQADKAIAATELLPKAVASDMPLQALLNSDEPVTLTPLQARAEQLLLSDGPQLFILEDVTGAGKTEAALLLAQRLMAGGHAHGLYFGLPTMATANAMYERFSEHGYRQLFQADQQPSLVLAHGAARLSDPFRRSIIGGGKNKDDNYEDQPAAAAHCSQWLADNRKKALLADVGIGTLDQALLGILPSRHQSLRLLGLIGKVLIIDEVHACDAYMHPLLCRLLRAHAAAGGSALLLSATLPQRQRNELATSFVEGMGAAKPTLVSTDYPLLTHVSSTLANESAIDTRESVRRHVQVQCVDSTGEVESVIANAIAQHQCACWIRNSVGDAREAYHHLRENHPDWQIELFHARFALADRLDIEQRVLDTYGKGSTHGQRAGHLLIATQVVEQSLDIDFDHLITDLAPIDLIIQRAGRLRRHRRDALGNPHDRPDQRGQPRLHLHIPEWTDDPTDGWFEKAFHRAAWVYPDHGQLWLGAKLLRDHGGFRMPEDARDLIEGVYDDGADLPQGLEGRSFSAQGEAKANQSIAMLNELKIELGYNDGATNRWWDDTVTPTRLGDPTTTVWMARWEDGQLKPWHNEGRFPWQQSSLSIRSELIEAPAATETIPQSAIDACQEKLPAGGRWGVLLPLVEQSDGAWVGQAVDGNGGQTIFRYSRNQGLITQKEQKAMDEKEQ